MTARTTAFGLETHVELSTATKVFCGCPTGFGAEPNSQTCPVCLGLPGALPVLGDGALEGAVKIALALGCTVSDVLRFDRKHYFYPDIPKGFQTSQADDPVGSGGHLDVLFEGDVVRVPIERVHLEEDTGKSTHLGGEGRIGGASCTLVDYNRSGIPLVEIVTKPVVGAVDPAGLARAYVSTLVELVRSLGVSDVRMEHGQLRSDVNVSVSSSDELGTRSETKNVASTRGVEAAVRFEVARQNEVLDGGGVVIQETRHFHQHTGETSSGRLKEDAEEYRYLPDPDQPVRVLPRQRVEGLRATLPMTGLDRRAALSSSTGLSVTTVTELEASGLLADVLATVELGVDAPAAASWWSNEAQGRDVTVMDASYLIKAVAAGELSTALAREVLSSALDEGVSASEVVERDGLKVDRDPRVLGHAVDSALTALPEIAEKARSNAKALGPLLGWVRRNHPELDPSEVRSALLARL